jgi:shikimate dehydrogenase
MRRFGLIGKTLKHSFSKTYFAQKFADEGITGCSYENYELPSIRDLPALLSAHPDLAGLNVTIPYKEACITYLHSSNETVKEIGACNCINIRNGKLHGYNTDAPAFLQSLQSYLQSHHTSALILGSGGASKAIQYALRQLKIDFLVVSRTKKTRELEYGDLNPDLMLSHPLIINTTPLGMYPNIEVAPPIPYDSLTRAHLLYDLTYNPEKTKFLRLGEQRGATVLNGYRMLVLQAEESWRIWNEGREAGSNKQ